MGPVNCVLVTSTGSVTECAAPGILYSAHLRHTNSATLTLRTGGDQGPVIAILACPANGADHLLFARGVVYADLYADISGGTALLEVG